VATVRVVGYDHTTDSSGTVSKQSLLLVDGDTRSLRVLEVSLRKAGFTVTPAESVQDALDKLELHVPDLIISETKFPTELDGFELRRRVRASADWAPIPFVFLTAATEIENKIRGLELGVEDYLTKPIYIKEIVTRINILLAKRQRLAFEERRDGTRFAGRVNDMPVVDVIQTIEVSRKSGVIQFTGPHERQAAIYFRDGKVIDAEAGTLQGEDAVYRLLTWGEGDFEVIFRTVRRREAITASSQGLLMEGMRRLDEWQRLLEQLPPLSHRFEIDTIELAARLGEVPDDNNRILRLIDGKRSLLEVIDSSDVGDLECLQAISRLYFEGMLLDLDPKRPQRRDSGRPGPLAMLSDSPMQAVASGPIDIDGLAARSDGAPQPLRTSQSEPTQPTEETDVISEETAEPGPLMGGYRPSSLRLIDEAVAAAQLIEPSLFEEDTKPGGTNGRAVAKVQIEPRKEDPRIGNARALVETNGVQRKRPPPPPQSAASDDDPTVDDPTPVPPPLAVPESDIDESDSVPTEIAAEEPDDGLADEGPTDPSRPPQRFAPTRSREESGLRMIGSHGRDSYATSGELRPLQPKAEPEPEPQREMVTIMPRRNTRELPAVVPPPEAEAGSAADAAEAGGAGPVEPPARPAPGAPPRFIPGSGTSAPDGPGLLAKILISAAAVLVGATVFSYCHKKHRQAPIAQGSGAGSTVQMASITPPDAAEPIGFGIDAAVAVAVDARAATVAKVDAAPAPKPDAAAATPATGSGDATDHVKQARDLLEQAQAALEDGDPEEALQLVDRSIMLRQTAKAYLQRAKTLQRLNRIDAALESVDDALKIVSNYAPAYEQRGMILWSAKRYDEARKALLKYLEIAPDGGDAEMVKKLLEEPR
jgi:DNA-binding response OmpR family regulator